MGFIRQSVTFCVLIVLHTYISSLLEQKLPVNVDGFYHPAFKRVGEVFRYVFITLKQASSNLNNLTDIFFFFSQYE
jgi:hypothetical protein